MRQTVSFQYDRAPAHFSHIVCNHLHFRFGQQWIGIGGPVLWPARSLDLSFIDFFLWGQVPVRHWFMTPRWQWRGAGCTNRSSYGEILDIPEIFQNMRNSMCRKTDACIELGGWLRTLSLNHVTFIHLHLSFSSKFM